MKKRLLLLLGLFVSPFLFSQILTVNSSASVSIASGSSISKSRPKLERNSHIHYECVSLGQLVAVADMLVFDQENGEKLGRIQKYFHSTTDK